MAIALGSTTINRIMLGETEIKKVYHGETLIHDTTGAPATVPAAFEAGDWSIAPGDEEADVTISSLPANGGAAITDIEYRLDGGSWVSSGGTTSFTIEGLTNDQEYDVELRAVNSVGAGAASDTKQVTPEAGGEWSPLDLGSKLKAWWDLNDPATLWADVSGTTPAADTDPVARIDDKSGNGHHAIQEFNSGLRPPRAEGQGCVFNNDDRMFVPHHADLAPTAQITIYSYLYATSSDALFAKEGPGATGYGSYGGNPNLYARINDGWVDSSGSFGPLPEDEWCSAALTYDGTHVRGWLNAAIDWSAENAGVITQGTNDFTLGFGASSGFSGILAAQLVCDQALTEGELALLDAYFAEVVTP